METYQLKKPSSVKKRKRVGTGRSSGDGRKCGRGQDGQRSRSGSTKRPWFEGGQMPLQRRVPKRGFTNIFKKEYQLVNISQLEKLNESTIDPVILKKAGLIKKESDLVKILGDGELTKSVKVVADAFSTSATEKITKAGGETVKRDLSQKTDSSKSE